MITQTEIMPHTKLVIGTLDGNKLFMETFHSLTELQEEILLRAKLDYLKMGPRFHKVYSGDVGRLKLDEILTWFGDKQGFDSAMLKGDNPKWILITREVE